MKTRKRLKILERTSLSSRVGKEEDVYKPTA